MTAQIQIYNPDSMAKPLGLYCHVARAKAQDYLHIAGQVSLDQAGELVGRGDFEAQLRQTYENLRAALESANAGFENVIKFTTYLTRKEDLGEYRRVRNALYEGVYPNGAYPPNTLLIVSGLVNDDLLIEIEAVAAV
ncbi:MAG: RidA family protein [Gammaproteobacteria bacterium]|nr:RidA family protein [Gammaproteobacteria bacterium]NIV49692.1 RidA family protein [Gammaproteobacteria bacterium]NIW57090.1 RidA family protein [Gammaproteobacteria bacterium]